MKGLGPTMARLHSYLAHNGPQDTSARCFVYDVAAPTSSLTPLSRLMGHCVTVLDTPVHPPPSNPGVQVPRGAGGGRCLARPAVVQRHLAPALPSRKHQRHGGFRDGVRRQQRQRPQWVHRGPVLTGVTQLDVSCLAYKRNHACRAYRAWGRHWRGYRCKGAVASWGVWASGASSLWTLCVVCCG